MLRPQVQRAYKNRNFNVLWVVTTGVLCAFAAAALQVWYMERHAVFTPAAMPPYSYAITAGDVGKATMPAGHNHATVQRKLGSTCVTTSEVPNSPNFYIVMWPSTIEVYAPPGTPFDWHCVAVVTE